MKTKKLLPIMLSGLLFLCACTATSPTTKPTAATTPSATVTPTATPDLNVVTSIWSEPKAGQKDHLIALWQETTNSPFFYNAIESEVYLDPYFIPNVDAAKLADKVFTQDVTAADSQKKIYGMIHNSSEAIIEGCAEIMLWLDCKDLGLYPTYVEITSIENGVLNITMYKAPDSMATVYGTDALPNNMLVVLSIDAGSNTNVSEYIKTVLVNYQEVGGSPTPPPATPYPDSPVAELDEDEVATLKELTDKIYAEDSSAVPMGIIRPDASVNVVSATELWQVIGLEDKISALKNIKISHDAYMGEVFPDVYGPIVVEKKDLYPDSTDGNLYVMTFVNQYFIYATPYDCTDISVTDGHLYFGIDLAVGGGDQAVSPRLIVMEISGVDVDDISTAEVRFNPVDRRDR